MIFILTANTVAWTSAARLDYRSLRETCWGRALWTRCHAKLPHSTVYPMAEWDNAAMREYFRRNEILWDLGFKSYRQYLRSSIWTDIRKKKLQHDPHCYGCGKPARQVHHETYTREILLGETMDGLYSICKRCHLWIEFTKSGDKRSPKDATDELKRIHWQYLGRPRVKFDDRRRALLRASRLKHIL
jgi:hypothetical protein